METQSRMKRSAEVENTGKQSLIFRKLTRYSPKFFNMMKTEVLAFVNSAFQI